MRNLQSNGTLFQISCVHLQILCTTMYALDILYVLISNYHIHFISYGEFFEILLICLKYNIPRLIRIR